MADSRCKTCLWLINNTCTKDYKTCSENDYDRYEQNKAKDSDPVNPAHYKTGKVECINAMTEEFGAKSVSKFCICNVFKYMWRYADKNGSEDLEKAKWYMNKYKELLEINGMM